MYTLTVDIGNTTISLGVFRGKKLALCFKLPTHNKGKAFYITKISSYLNKLNLNKRAVERIVLCSVVPKKTPALRSLFRDIFKSKILVVGKEIRVPIKNKYRIPSQVGQDRLVNAYAALSIYGPGLIIVDFGTAVTFDVVSKNSEYLGGLIFPGLDLSLEALYLEAALLPRIKLKKPKTLLGRDTVNSINCGIVFGMAGVCDTLIDKLQKKFKGYKVVATGGNAKFIKQHSKKIKIICPNLTLEGLQMLGCC